MKAKNVSVKKTKMAIKKPRVAMPEGDAGSLGGMGALGMKKGGSCKGYAKGGSIDGIASKGKTRGKIC